MLDLTTDLYDNPVIIDPATGYLKLDHTKRSTFVTCPAKYNYNWNLGIKPEKGSTALRFGIVWHDVIAAFFGHIAEHGWTRDGGALHAAVEVAQASWQEESEKQEFWEDYRTLENLMLMLITYIDHFASDEGILKIIQPEMPFKILIVPTNEEMAKWPGIEPTIFTGRLDLEVELSMRPWLVEFKTTGQALALQKKRLHRSPQVTGYNYAARHKLEMIPDGSLVTICHISAYKSKKTGLYGKPKIDFARVPEIRTPEDLETWRESFMYTAHQIRQCMKTNVWPCFQDNCYVFGRCGYADLCEQNKSIEELNLHGYFVDDIWDVTAGMEEGGE